MICAISCALVDGSATNTFWNYATAEILDEYRQRTIGALCAAFNALWMNAMFQTAWIKTRSLLQHLLVMQ